jgi:hypothetical protein
VPGQIKPTWAEIQVRACTCRDKMLSAFFILLYCSSCYMAASVIVHVLAEEKAQELRKRLFLLFV